MGREGKESRKIRKPGDLPGKTRVWMQFGLPREEV